MDSIKFSYNWNNKLSNKAFTTLRLHNDNKYKVNSRYEIELNNQIQGVATIHNIKTLTLNQLNNYITYLDTGYNVTEAKKILQTMYKNKPIDWDTQKLDFILLVYEK